ncbi:YjbE family putative metal transport protein [Methylocella sp.]|uniref:YjbE family putative metal transport protein n=1 Tax=Methylocella sp. TaxID=1978226 RepID=UPI0037835CFB
MDGAQGLIWTGVEIVIIDLLLSADNAVVIAMACRRLPQHLVKRAIAFGAGVAILLRVALAAVVAVLFVMPGLKLFGALALIVIAVKLMGEEQEPAAESAQEEDARQTRNVLNAIFIVIAADFVMSLDNVVALAAVARGDVGALIFGLALSIPMLMFGSAIVHTVLARYPSLIFAGGALLGWIAGSILVDDPLIADWARREAPALGFVAPALTAVFVVAQAAIIRAEKAGDAALRDDAPDDVAAELAAGKN